MAKGEDKRKIIFDKYVAQLRLLNDKKLLPGTFTYEEDTYVCPICLDKFSVEDLKSSSKKMLTLEDAPPKALGGHSNTLTCKKCNSEAGHKIDCHLNKRLVELNVRSFLPNTSSKAKFTYNGITVNGQLQVENDGEITVKHNEKFNEPKGLKQYIESTKKDNVIDLEFAPSSVDTHRLEVALLKTAYMLAFEKFGYALILDKSYDIVREQIKNPEKYIYPMGFWTKQSSFRKIHEGVHVIDSGEFNGFFAIFTLETGPSKYMFGAYLPVSDMITDVVILKLRGQEAGFALPLKSLKQYDYFENTENMERLYKLLQK